MKGFYVAVSGNDENPGTKEAPFASLCRARDAFAPCGSKGSVRRWMSTSVRVNTMYKALH